MRLTKIEVEKMLKVANEKGKAPLENLSEQSANPRKIQLNKNELDTVLKLLEEQKANEVEIESNGGSGIGIIVTAKIDNVDHDVTDYGCW